ncbi:hypothetical protein [Bacillus marinisedimentorum]|uniref:hypothetical protein n=1 Tax=Bacillus marinisedimentorum TaxID=1821260 RepID=UPI0007E241A5|nr:hypothetical protein [Bacillus marinisedimentorum]
MKSRDLEFRGINLNHLGMYFEELGGRKMSDTDAFPLIYTGDGWSGQILREEDVAITKTFIVNAVHIRFLAESAEKLDELIKNYRYKTTRIGG